MAVRRWDARFEEEHLVLRRWRLLPWPRAYVRRIPLAEILDIGSFTATDQAKRHAQLSVQDPSAPDLSEVIPVSFTREQWTFAGWFMEEWRAAKRRAAPTAAATPSESIGGPGGPVPPGGGRCGPGAATGAAGGSLRAHLSFRQASTTPSITPGTNLRATPSTHLRTKPSATLSARSTTSVMRPGDGPEAGVVVAREWARSMVPPPGRRRLAAQSDPSRRRPSPAR